MCDQDEASIAGQPSTTPRHSFGSSGILSYSSNTSISASTTSTGSIKSDCLGAWLNYLQILNNLCASGYRLAQAISTLEQWSTMDSTVVLSNITQQQQQPQQPQQSTGPSNQPQTPTGSGGSNQSTPQQSNISSTSNTPISTQFINAWDDLARATAVATSTVKSHIVGVLQDFIIQSSAGNYEESELQRIREHNQQIILETAQTMVNIQHQFCVASYNSFSALMCCFICQAPVGLSHDADCAMVQPAHQSFQKRQSNATSELRSQTPSPHFGQPLMNSSQKSDRGGYLCQQQLQQQQQQGEFGKNTLYGSGSSSDHSCGGSVGPSTGPVSSGINMDMQNTTRGPSPHQDIRGPSPIHGFLDSIRGPLPNPGHLLGMKAPFHRCSRSPLNFPLFPLNGQRRWSEAAAGEVKGESIVMDAESQMRRWSMPWEASKTDKNTVTWHQTRIMPISKLAVPVAMAPSSSTLSKGTTDRSQSTTPDSIYQPSATSQDGLAEAIQLLSCRPSRIYQPTVGPPFEEEPHSIPGMGTYEMWSNRDRDRLPCIKFHRDWNRPKDESQQPQ